MGFPKGQKHLKLTAGGVLVTENAAFRKSQINISGGRYQMDFVKNDRYKQTYPNLTKKSFFETLFENQRSGRPLQGPGLPPVIS